MHNPCKDIEFVSDLPAIKEVKQLHHDESVEDKGEVPRLDPCLPKDRLIVIRTINLNISPTTDSPSNNAIVPLPIRISRKVALVVVIDLLGNKSFSQEDYNAKKDQLEAGLPYDMFHHCFRNEMLVSAVRLPLK